MRFRAAAAVCLLLAGAAWWFGAAADWWRRPLRTERSGFPAESPTGLASEGQVLELFVGSASKPATQEVARRFEAVSGAKLQLHFGGSGKMLASLKLAERGDLYFPGSSDYMELAKRDGLVLAETERRVVYLIPAINVPTGNPGGVRGLADLARRGLRLGMGRPDTVCVGLYAAEVLERAGIADGVRPNVATYAESCERVAQVLSLGSVDAVLGWEVFAHWDPERIETVYLSPEEVPRIGYIPIAMTRYVQNRALAQAFIDFLVSEEGRDIYRRWHYLTTEDEARAYALEDTPVGGVWSLPATWQRLPP